MMLGFQSIPVEGRAIARSVWVINSHFNLGYGFLKWKTNHGLCFEICFFATVFFPRLLWSDELSNLLLTSSMPESYFWISGLSDELISLWWQELTKQIYRNPLELIHPNSLSESLNALPSPGKEINDLMIKLKIFLNKGMFF